MMIQPEKIREIIRIDTIYPDMSNRQLGKLTNCSHQSVGRVLKRVKLNGISHAIAIQLKNKELIESLYPCIHISDKKYREPDYDEHVKQSLLKKGKSRTLLYLEYRAKAPSTALSKSQYFSKVRKFLKTTRLAMRQTHVAGDVVYIDYAGTKVFYSKDGQKISAKVFVAVLGASKKLFAFATPGERTKDWINGIVAMFKAFGGVTSIVSIDNATALVSKPGLIPVLVKNIVLLGEFYHCIFDSCRVASPQDKSLAELGVKWVKQRILIPMNHDMTFFSLDEVNAHLSKKVEELNNLPLQKLKISRNELFEQTDGKHLRPLPKKPFEAVDVFKMLIVPADYHIEHNKHFYSVPYKLAHEEVEVVVTNTNLKVFHQHQLEAIHKLSEELNGSTTVHEHLSPEHSAEALKTKDEYMKWAKGVGPLTQVFVEKQYEVVRNPKSRAIGKRVQNLMRLCLNKPQEHIEQACEYAIENNMPPSELGMVFKMLEHLETKASVLMPPTAHKNIRGKNSFGGNYAH
ncbi:hypothetical protein OAP14_02480 [Aliiglaciecola sp.]|nr:hypothetical protein [Aliiglaciecola sp.]